MSRVASILKVHTPARKLRGTQGCLWRVASRLRLSSAPFPTHTLLYSAVWGMWWLMIVFCVVENAPFPTGSPPLISLIRPESLCHVQLAGRPANARMKLL